MLLIFQVWKTTSVEKSYFRLTKEQVQENVVERIRLLFYLHSYHNIQYFLNYILNIPHCVFFEELL
jgi:hypothetical protein